MAVSFAKRKTAVPAPPSRVTGIGGDGHMWDYRVVAPLYMGDAPRLSRWDAVHSPMCGCTERH